MSGEAIQFIATVVIPIGLFVAYDWYRTGRRLDMALDTPTPQWAARHLRELVQQLNPHLADVVLLVTIEYGLANWRLARSYSTRSGAHFVRLHYSWHTIEPHLHLSKVELSERVLRKLAEPGEVLRARLRAAADERNIVKRLTEAVMATGVVKRLVPDRGFGFIRPDDGSDELFFHRSTVQGGPFEDLREGSRVRYEEVQSNKGPRAEKVAEM